MEQVQEEHTKIAELSRKIGEILVERGDYEQAIRQFQTSIGSCPIRDSRWGQGVSLW